MRIGVLNDGSGPYSDLSGLRSMAAAQLAVEDFNASSPGGEPPFQVEIRYADHQNKADIGAEIVRRWVDTEGVSAVVDVPNTSVALAVNEIMRDRDRVFLGSSVASSDLTGPKCAATTVQWTFDTWALANATGSAVVADGGDSWFFLTADYAFGQALERDASDVVRRSGGKVLGSVRHPLGAPDFSSFLLRAQSSGAKVIGLANAGGDAVTAIKQAREFGVLNEGRSLAGLLVFLSDVHSLGLETAQGLRLTEAFYWDLNERTRDWSRRFAERVGGSMPTMNHAGVYSSVLAYLNAVAAVGPTAGGTRVVDRMKETAIDDPLFGPVTIRPDGRVIHAMYLFQVKPPERSSQPWDYYDLVSTIPAEKAFRPIEDGGCPLVK
ncbi:ABC transporter permease [Skermanella stibiiresistens SB22]|uniref:ABC transporter permease n=1 Tax=Skermanella stibiiresistens SB22 TaxID=1385369 RepID=W9H6R3_9PROT|nr:ABC transporter permease [Skermanella stibiiresistens SB22]